MNSNNNVNFKTKNKNFKFFILFVFMFLSHLTSSAQTDYGKSIVEPNTATITPTQDKEIASMDFAIWFMGSINNEDASIKSKTFSKKQLINSGVFTNSVLIRSFLKKISNQESSIS